MKDRLHGGPPLTFARLRGRLLERFHEALPLNHSLTRRCVRLERDAIVESIAHLHNHHKTPAEEIYIHLLDADSLQAVLHLGPNIAVMPRVGFANSRLVFQIHREDMPSTHWLSTPPSSGYACPVTNDASSEQRYNARYATSSGVPMRPIG